MRTVTKNPKTFWEAVEYILNNFRISIHILSNGMDSFDVTLVWSDWEDGGANKIKTSRKRGSSPVIFMLVRNVDKTTIKEGFSPAKPQSFMG